MKLPHKITLPHFMVSFLALVLLLPFSANSTSTEVESQKFDPAKPLPSQNPSTLTFVQITDAHLFDAGKKADTRSAAEKEQEDNWDAFRWSIERINSLQNAGAGIEFVVFTGDFGLECMLEPGEPICNPPKDPAKMDQVKTRGWPNFDDSRSAPGKVAKEFSRLRVPGIYLLPGNNDLVGEVPADIKRYRKFVQDLRDEMPNRSPALADLTDAKSSSSEAGVFQLLGLNSASFKAEKNYNGLSNTTEGHPDFEMARIRQALASRPDRTFLLFTHIPDLKDPLPVENPKPSQDCKTLKPDPPHSNCDAWGEFPSRLEWEGIATDPRIAAIFAGHFHSSNRSFYGVPASETSLAINPEIAAKTLVAPPLAIKFQDTSASRARGFLLVRVQQRISGPGVVTSAIPFWYEGPPHESYWPTIEVVLVLIGLFAPIALMWVRSLRQRDPTVAAVKTGSRFSFRWVYVLEHPLFLTLFSFAIAVGLIWEAWAFAIGDLAVPRSYALSAVFGTLGGLAGAIWRDKTFIPCSIVRDPAAHFELGTLHSCFLGFAGATAVLFFFSTTIHLEQGRPESLISLISASLVAGAFGANIMQLAGVKLMQQVAREVAESVVATEKVEAAARERAKQDSKKEQSDSRKEEG